MYIRMYIYTIWIDIRKLWKMRFVYVRFLDLSVQRWLECARPCVWLCVCAMWLCNQVHVCVCLCLCVCHVCLCLIVYLIVTAYVLFFNQCLWCFQLKIFTSYIRKILLCKLNLLTCIYVNNENHTFFKSTKYSLYMSFCCTLWLYVFLPADY